MTIKSLVLIASLLVSLGLSSAFADENKVSDHNIGVAAGFVTGYGLSYRQWFGKNGVQVTLAPYYSNDTMETNFTMSFGAVGLRMLKEARFVNLFAYYGAHAWYMNDKRLEYDGYYPQQTNGHWVYDKQKRLFVGGGPGMDIHFWRLSFNLMFGLAFSTDFVKSTGVSFSGETGLYYSF